MARAETWVEEAVEWADSVLADFEGRYSLVDESFSRETVRIVGPHDRSFDITMERWRDSEDHDALGFELKAWARAPFE